jgi:hypothetical protein
MRKRQRGTPVPFSKLGFTFFSRAFQTPQPKLASPNKPKAPNLQSHEEFPTLYEVNYDFLGQQASIPSGQNKAVVHNSVWGKKPVENLDDAASKPADLDDDYVLVEAPSS